LCECVASASAAFLGSCNSVHELASTLLSIDVNQLRDKRLFGDPFASFGIRSQTRLMTLAHPSGTSSGWLKAIPRACLGLAVPGPEFVIGRIWLRVSLFPLSPLCTCLSTMVTIY